MTNFDARLLSRIRTQLEMHKQVPDPFGMWDTLQDSYVVTCSSFFVLSLENMFVRVLHLLILWFRIDNHFLCLPL